MSDAETLRNTETHGAAVFAILDPLDTSYGTDDAIAKLTTMFEPVRKHCRGHLNDSMEIPAHRSQSPEHRRQVLQSLRDEVFDLALPLPGSRHRHQP